MSRFDFAWVDVFATKPLTGNQLAVFKNAQFIPEELLLPLARELNLAEIVMLYPKAADQSWPIRIFTAAREIRFAGHPIMGAAFVASQLDMEAKDDIVLIETGGEKIEVLVSPTPSGGFHGNMVQPLPRIASVAKYHQNILAALGLVDSLLPIDIYDNGLRHVHVFLEDPNEVASLKPNLQLLSTCEIDTVCCFSRRGSDWVARVFIPDPDDPVPEDPATGSSAGPLSYHLARYRVIDYGDEVNIYQGEFIKRPSRLTASTQLDESGRPRISVRGDGFIIGEGHIDL